MRQNLVTGRQQQLRTAAPSSLTVRAPLDVVAARRRSKRCAVRSSSPSRPATRCRHAPADASESAARRLPRGGVAAHREAERNSREKKGQIGAALWGPIRARSRRTNWHLGELRARQASGAKPPKRTAQPETPPSNNNPFAGVMKAFKDVYDEADAMGYAQAVALNKQLEDRGVLSKAKRKDDDDVQIPEERVVFEEPVRKTVKRKRGKGAKPKSRKGAGFS